MRTTMSTATRLLTACLCVLPLAAPGAPPPFDPALSRSPPAVASASVELLAQPSAQGNALLRVRFADQRKGGSLVIQGGPGPTLLRDDGVAPDQGAGDGLYAAQVQVNASQFSREQQRRLDLSLLVQTVPEYQQRQLIARRIFKPTAQMTLVEGQPRLLDVFRGVPDTVDPARELIVRDLAVVDDPARTYEPCTGAGTPMGAWTFGRLMTEMANPGATGIDPSLFVENWISQWTTEQTVNGFTLPPRGIGAELLLYSWPRRPDGHIDLARAPFRLLAIVNRLDLRGNTLFGPSDSAEARLVFGAVQCVPVPIPWRPPMPEALMFTVIFEFSVPARDCLGTRSWANQWRNLSTMPLGSPVYNKALQRITDQFTLRNARPDRPPNRSALNQLRTNEFALADMPSDPQWQLRESRLVASGTAAGQLRPGTTAQTPDGSRWGSASLRDFINTQEAAILRAQHLVPAQYPAGVPFLGGAVDIHAGAPWQAPGILNEEARHRFSLATCNGCHIAETSVDFLHIEPRNRGTVSRLSGFVTGEGMPVVDPRTGVSRTFNELLDRQMKLDAAANLSCVTAADMPLEDLFFIPHGRAFAH